MMMDRIRGAAQHILFKILIGVIILSFILSGGFYYIGATPTYAVKVNGEEYSLQQFDNLVQNRSFSLPEDADNDAIDALKKDTLKSIIDEMLLEQYIKSLGVTLANDQIKMLIAKNPMFLNESGQFDPERYSSFLKERDLNGDQLAEYIRTRELTSAVMQDLGNVIFTLPSEVDEYAKLILQKRTIRKAPIDLKAFTDKQTITDDELKTFYEEHQLQYTLPQAVKLSYVSVDRTDFLNRIDSDADAVRTYYQTHLAQKNFAIIQVKSKTEAEKILEELKGGADFAKIAAERSLDIGTKNSGGELGMMNPQDLPDAFRELRDQNLTEEGQLSSVISVNNQFVVAKLVAIEDNMPKEATPEYQALVTQMKAELSTDLFFEIQQKMGESLAQQGNLDDLASIAGLKVQSTELFDKANPPAALKYDAVLAEAFNSAFTKRAGDTNVLSDLIAVNDDKVVIIRLDEFREKKLQTLEEVKSQVTTDLKLKKSEQEVNSLVEEAIAQLEQGEMDALTALNTQFKEAETLTADSDDPAYRQDIDFLKAIFAIPLPQEGQSSYQMLKNQAGETFIVALDKVEYPTPTEDERNKFENTLNSLKARQLSDNLLKRLKAEADIQYGEIGIDMTAQP